MRSKGSINKNKNLRKKITEGPLTPTTVTTNLWQGRETN